MSSFRLWFCAALVVLASSCASLATDYDTQGAAPAITDAPPGPALNDVVLTKVAQAPVEDAIPDPAEIERDLVVGEQTEFCQYLASTALMINPGETGTNERIAALLALASFAPAGDQQFFNDVADLHRQLAADPANALAAALLDRVLQDNVFTLANYQGMCDIDIVAQFEMNVLPDEASI